MVLEKTVLELRGTPCLELDDEPAPKQQIMVSRSFGSPVTELPGLVEAVSQFAIRAAEKLRQQNGLAGALQVFISTSPHRQHDRQHSPSITLPMVRPSADSRNLVDAAVAALRQMYRTDHNYVKAGVMLVDLQEAGAEGVQQQAELDLFAQPAAQQQEPAGSSRDRSQLMGAMDALNRRFGRGAVTIASAVKQVGGGFAVRQERRSPRWTTRLDEIPVARC